MAAAREEEKGKSEKTLSSHILSLELSFSEMLTLMVEKEMLTLMGMTVMITRLLKSHKLDLSTVTYLIVEL